MMMSQVKKYSQEISSNYPDEHPQLRKSINNNILDKYLTEQTPCLDAMERALFRVLPYWNTSRARITKNIAALLQGNWQFDFLEQSKPMAVFDKNITNSIIADINDPSLLGKNISIYLVFWLPLTTMLLAHVLHNAPNQQSKFGVLGTGLIMLFFMFFISFGLYIYSNVLGSPYNMYLQHLCLSSFVSIVGFIFAVLCAASPTVLLIPMTLVYLCVSTALHFRIYNNAIKPTLIQMVILLLMLIFFYSFQAYLYYANFSKFWTTPSDPTSLESHQLIRHFQPNHL